MLDSLSRSGVSSGIAIAVLVLAGAVDAQQNLPDRQDITPPQVQVHVDTLRAELDQLRLLMGQPTNQQPDLHVADAAPREVYFQALTLFEKAERFCFEHTRERLTPPEPAQGEPRPADVHDLVDASLTCIRRVKIKYGIHTESPPAEVDPAKQPTDVFKSIVQTNRQLNLMLERRFAPEDVFQRVTVGVGYASRLLEQIPDVESLPDEPEYQAGKRPVDVYRKLVECFHLLRAIAEKSGLQMLELEVDEANLDKVGPSDVYDIASLIVAELDYLHSKLPDAKPPRNVYDVGRKFPSHVFQRAGMLELQLRELERHAVGNPGWLNGNPENR